MFYEMYIECRLRDYKLTFCQEYRIAYFFIFFFIFFFYYSDRNIALHGDKRNIQTYRPVVILGLGALSTVTQNSRIYIQS